MGCFFVCERILPGVGGRSSRSALHWRDEPAAGRLRRALTHGGTSGSRNSGERHLGVDPPCTAPASLEDQQRGDGKEADGKKVQKQQNGGGGQIQAAGDDKADGILTPV